MSLDRPPPALAGKKGKVLIVDDDQVMCETLAACLGRRGFAVAWRTSARDALALLDGQDFDVIVTDLNMDEMDGLALCERVVVIRPDLPVIVMTACGTPEIKVAVFSAGAYEFMAKPLDLECLLLALSRAVLSGSVAKPKGRDSFGT
jgi:DNA-binding NtrC family response regulator